MSRPEAAEHDLEPAPFRPADHVGDGAFSRPKAADHGFVALDVLIGVFVLALLFLTVITSVGPYRQRSWQASAVSDARQLGGRIEATLSDSSTLAAAGLPAAEDTLSDSLLDTLGVNLTRGIAVARYTPLSSTKFQVCLVHYSGSVVDAYALYDSTRGRVIASGRGAGPAACVPASAAPPTPTPTSSPTPTTGPEVPTPTVPGPTTPPASSIATPANLQVNSVPGEPKAAVTWDAVSGAAGYALYLDGGSTPAWTGTGLTTDLTGLPTGPHSVTVTARAGGDESTKSSAVAFTIYGDNDFIRFAHPVNVPQPGSTWTSRDYNNTPATSEAGEPTPARKTMWWSIDVPRDATYTFRVVAPTTGAMITNPNVRVWKSSATAVTDLGAHVADASTVATVAARAGEKYLIRVADACGCAGWNGPLRLEVAAGPENDSLPNAQPISGLTPGQAWFSPDGNNTYAGADPGDSASIARSVWWTITIPRDSYYTFRIVADSTGAGPRQTTVRVWRTTSTDVTSLGTPVASNYNEVSVDGRSGQTYKVQMYDSCNCVDFYGPHRLRVWPGPTNDSLVNAATIPDVAAGSTWHSPDVDNTFAGAETGEPGGNRNSIWWTFMPTRSGTYTFRPVAPSTGGTAVTQPQVRVWNSTATDVTALGTMLTDAYNAATITATAGQTYKVRVIDPCGCAGWYGPMRLQVTG